MERQDPNFPRPLVAEHHHYSNLIINNISTQAHHQLHLHQQVNLAQAKVFQLLALSKVSLQQEVNRLAIRCKLKERNSFTLLVFLVARQAKQERVYSQRARTNFVELEETR